MLSNLRTSNPCFLYMEREKMKVGKENGDEKGKLWESKREREMWMKCKQGMHAFTSIRIGNNTQVKLFAGFYNTFNIQPRVKEKRIGMWKNSKSWKRMRKCSRIEKIGNRDQFGKKRVWLESMEKYVRHKVSLVDFFRSIHSCSSHLSLVSSTGSWHYPEEKNREVLCIE